ncbi:MAG: hypothetical protein CMG13_04150 [Candidatus Marinimicrobia bacterium]|nr:hypothetical protein [Candidatus Neomarinimicrobiota bacterium]
MINIDYIYYLLVSFTSALIFMPIGLKIIKKLNIVDKPNYRKIHKQEILSGGGIIVFFGMLVSFIIMVALSFNNDSDFTFNYVFSFFMLGFSILFLMGILDDRLNLKAKSKFFLQIIACLLFILLSGQSISFDFIIENEIFSIVMTLFFMLSIINAFNLIDGLDGLASGLSLISLLSLSLISNESTNYMIYPLIGSTLTFLIRNSYPAKMFLGDSGSYVLGYSLSVFIILIINSSSELNGTLKIAYMLFFIAIPVIDVIYAFSRRLINKVNIFSPDRKHLHHQLLNRDIKHEDAVFILYLIHSLFSFVGLVILGAHLSDTIIILFIPFIYFAYIVFKLNKFQNNLPEWTSRFFKHFNSRALFVLFPALLFLNINAISNEHLFNQSLSIIALILIASCAFIVFKDFENDIPLILCTAVIVFASSDFYSTDNWANIFSSYIYYFITIILILSIFINTKKIIFHPSSFLIIVFAIILSSAYRLDFYYVFNFMILLGVYQILLKDNIIRQYRLLHLINIVTLLVILCI